MTYFTEKQIKSVTTAFAEGQHAINKATDNAVLKQNKAIQALLDTMLAGNALPKAEFMKGNARTNPARAGVADLFKKLHTDGYIKSKSADQYASCFWFAFEHGVPFARDLLNEKSKASSEDKGSGARHGSVSTTTIESLYKSAQKCIQQARLLNENEIASDWLDVAVNRWPEFAELAE